jgi:hypothetical protein
MTPVLPSINQTQLTYGGNRQGDPVTVALTASEATQATRGRSLAVTSAIQDEKGHQSW